MPPNLNVIVRSTDPFVTYDVARRGLRLFVVVLTTVHVVAKKFVTHPSSLTTAAPLPAAAAVPASVSAASAVPMRSRFLRMFGSLLNALPKVCRTSPKTRECPRRVAAWVRMSAWPSGSRLSAVYFS
jgi:hypothetical protein